MKINGFAIITILIFSLNLSSVEVKQNQLKSLSISKLIKATQVIQKDYPTDEIDPVMRIPRRIETVHPDIRPQMRLAMLYSIAAFTKSVSYDENDLRNLKKGISEPDHLANKLLTVFKDLFQTKGRIKYLYDVTLYWPQKHYLIGWNKYSGKIINKKNLHKSIQILHMELQINRYNLEARLMKAWNYKELGEKDKARDLLRKIVAISWIFEKDFPFKNETIFPNRSHYLEASEYLIEILDREKDTLEIEELQKNRAVLLAKFPV